MSTAPRFRALLGALLGVSLLGPLAAAEKTFADMSLEELMNESVTSVSKRSQKLSDVAAAISVLSHDDIRRSGATSIAEALRLVPGLQVATIDSANWAISARGFNTQLANKLLVMIDGRSVYSPVFSGTYWDIQHLFLDDVDRIEVIRGPGATIWGANAVNGVINISSKSARETQGGLLYAGGGDGLRRMGGVRYGGKLGARTYYRAFASYQLSGDFPRSNGEPAGDRWDLGKAGFRVDHYTPGDGQLTWQADGYAGALAARTGEVQGFNTLARWTRRGPGGSGYEIQAYFDHTFRDDVLAKVAGDTADLTWQHTLSPSARHDVIWGLGYRFLRTRVHRANSPAITLLDGDTAQDVVSAFVQEEFKILPERLVFTLGTKVEHNDLTGVEVQPGARLVFKPQKNQTVWAAVSRAVQTTSQFDGTNFAAFAVAPPLTGPDGGLYVPTIVGNPGLKSEVLWAHELGYRIQPSSRVSLDAAAFYNVYHGLLGRSPGAFLAGVPVGIMTLVPRNTLHGETYGGEAVLAVAPTDAWRLSASYSLLLMRVHGEPKDDATALEANAPTHQVVLRSAYDFSSRLSLDGQVRYVDNVRLVRRYFAADLRLSFRPTANLELSLVGQNLFDDRHLEQTALVSLPTAEAPRRFHGKITWRF